LYARIVNLNLKPNQLKNFQDVLDKHVIPLLRKQTGFKDEITFAGPGGTELRTISCWETKANAEAYNSTAYPEVLKALATVLDGTPKIKSYDVVSSTLHKLPVFTTV
jgi:hypothetical protein